MFRVLHHATRGPLGRRVACVTAPAPRLLTRAASDFASLGVSPPLVAALARAGLQTPTAAQRRAIPAILRARDVVIAAETGGGKTLAYLVPLLERLAAHPLPTKELHRPVGLVLTTSQELVRQVLDVLRRLAPEVAAQTVALSSSQQTLSTGPRHGGCALLLATPKALLRATRPKDFAFTECIVVDEADMLLGGGFERDTKQILATIRNQPLKPAHRNQRALSDHDSDDLDDDDEIASGTSRQTVFSAFPQAEFAVTEDFHRTLPRLDVAVHQLDAPDNEAVDPMAPRLELLWRILRGNDDDDDDDGAGSSSTGGGNTLVFANTIESAEAAHTYLTTVRGRACELYHKEVPRAARQAILERLRAADAAAGGTIVVCTDIAARGLDTTTVRHVVQFEFANDVVSYIHRIGRTARAGTTGRVSSIVSPENALVLAKIQEAGGAALNGAFSRKRSLRKKVKKARRHHGERHQSARDESS